MKKLFITSVLAVLSLSGFAQTTTFDKFQNIEGINSVVINKKFLEIAGNTDTKVDSKTAQKYLNFVQSFDNLKIFTSTESKYCKALSNTVESYLSSHPLIQLFSINDEGTKVKMYIEDGGKSNQINEILMFVEDDKEVVVISFTGSITI